MTPEELWASLEPQAKAMEAALEQRDIAEQMVVVGLDYSALEAVYAHAVANGQAVYAMGVDPALRGSQGMVILMDDVWLREHNIDEVCDTLQSIKDEMVTYVGHPDQLSPTGRLIDMEVGQIDRFQVITAEERHDRRTLMIGHGRRGSSLGAAIAAVLAASPPSMAMVLDDLDSLFTINAADYRLHQDVYHGPAPRKIMPKANHKHQKNIFRTTMRSVNRNR